MNILVLTPLYPLPGATNNPTKVVKYFVDEWNKLGENVRVIAMPSYFMAPLYHMPKFVERILSQRFNSPVEKVRHKEIKEFDIDGIPVLRLPLFKAIPGQKVSLKQVTEKCEKVEEYLKKEDFTPDVIVAHWTEPTLPFVAHLKEYYQCPAVMVSHSDKIKYYPEKVNSIDLWGYRRPSCIDSFKHLFPSVKFGFRCYSGIPSYFLNNLPTRDYTIANRFVYVGVMLQRKYPDVVIDTIIDIYQNDSSFKLSMLGDGILLDSLRNKVAEYGIAKQIHLPGRVDREEIIRTLDESDIFIMISRGEVYGLVYIEAMARGCIVIASRNEGMEGIIENGKNGFLIEAGSLEELKATIQFIQNLTPEQRKEISQNAISTAKKLTDEKVAKQYLTAIKDLVASSII